MIRDDHDSTTGTSRRGFLKLTAAAFGSLLVPGFSPPRRPFPGSKEPPLEDWTEADRRELARYKRVKIQGAATRAPALEFHGDSYNLAGGGYSMNPDMFRYLMEWFQDNDVWAMTADEVVGYINGTLEIPTRSVILTTDSGSTSRDSLARMIPVLQDTSMHFISFIWTKRMDPGENDLCIDDRCWGAFREAQESGVFSFGTHTESHRDFAKLTPDEGIQDLLQANEEIESNLGIVPNLIAWPFESYPNWASMLENYGFEGGFAGNSRFAMSANVVLPNEPLPWSIPRVLPPNPGTLTSGRPNGLTIQEMMEMFSNGF